MTLPGLPAASEQKAARNLRVAFRSFGCKLNLYEISGIRRQTQDNGLTVVPSHEEETADIVVVNTCSVTLRADQEARQFIRAVHRKNSETRIVVTGCYAQRAPQELSSLNGVALVAGHAEKDTLANLLLDLPRPGEPARVLVGELKGKSMPLLRSAGLEERTRAYLRLQDGCDCSCTYCVIPKTRGGSVSLAFDEALDEARRLLDAGFREIVLTGTHLGHYGLDLEKRRRLSDFVTAVMTLPSTLPFRMRLSSVEPQEIDDPLIELMQSEPRLVPHLHLPLQSGSDRVLRAMRRAYRTKNYRKQVERVARAVSPLGLGADLIVGFPGETEEDFRTTLSFLADLPFTYLHPFTYSPRPGTPAASWPGRPPGNIASRRLHQAKALIARKNLSHRRELIGRTATVLVEETTSQGIASGFEETYVRVQFPVSRVMSGHFARVRITGVGPHGLTGRPIEGLL